MWDRFGGRTSFLSVIILSASLALSGCGSTNSAAAVATTAPHPLRHVHHPRPRTSSTSGSISPKTSVATAPPPPAPTSGTEVVTYSPIANGALGVGESIVGHYSGTCTSGYVGTDVTYRCFTDRQSNGSSVVLDPCWSGLSGDNALLVCPVGPVYVKRVVLLDASDFSANAPATTEVSSPQAPTQPQQWQFELSNGVTCEMINAAWNGLGPFQCGLPGSTSTPADCHIAAQGSPWWTASCQAELSTSSPFTSYRVLRIWSTG